MANEAKIKISVNDQASKGLDSIGAKAKNMRGAFLAVGAAGAAVVGALALSIKSFAQTGDEIQKMGLRTGVSTVALSELKFALEQSGSSLEGFEKGIRRMSSFIQDGRDGLTETTRAMESLGLSVEAFDDLSPEAAFDLLTKSLAGVDDSLTQAALAQDIFGRSGTALLPMLAQGQDGIAKLRKEAHDLGIVFDQDAADAAARLVDAQNTLRKSVDGVKFAIAEQLVPSLTPLVEGFAKTISKVSEWAKENPVLAKTITVLAGGLGSVAIGLAGIGLVIPSIITGIQGVTAAMTFMLANPIILGIAALVAALVVLNKVITDLHNNSRDAALKGMDVLSKSIEDMQAAAGRAGESLTRTDAALQSLQDEADGMAKAIDGANDAWKDYVEEITKTVFVERLTAAIDEFNLTVEQITPILDSANLSIEDYNTLLDQAGVNTAELIKVNDDLSVSLDGVSVGLGEAGDAAKEAEDAFNNLVAEIEEGRQKIASDAMIAFENARQLAANRVEIERTAEEEIANAEAASLQLRADAISTFRDKQKEIEQDTFDFRSELREASVVEAVRLLALENDAVEAAATRNAAAFAKVQEAVMLLPSQISVDGGIPAGGGGVASMFKASQRAVEEQLASARAQLAVGDFGGGTTAAMVQAEIDRLMGVTGSAQFKGERLGELFAPPGGFGTTAPPMLPGMTMIFNGDVYGLDEFDERVNQAIMSDEMRGIAP